MSPTHHPFTKRADTALPLPEPVLVLLIMFGACALTCVGYAIHKTFGFGPDANVARPMSIEQMEYMAEVKGRNLNVLAREGKGAWGQGRGRRGGETVYEVGNEGGG